MILKLSQNACKLPFSQSEYRHFSSGLVSRCSHDITMRSVCLKFWWKPLELYGTIRNYGVFKVWTNFEVSWDPCSQTCSLGFLRVFKQPTQIQLNPVKSSWQIISLSFEELGQQLCQRWCWNLCASAVTWTGSTWRVVAKVAAPRKRSIDSGIHGAAVWIYGKEPGLSYDVLCMMSYEIPSQLWQIQKIFEDMSRVATSPNHPMHFVTRSEQDGFVICGCLQRYDLRYKL